MNTITTNFQGISHTFSQFVTSQGTKISSLSKPALEELGIYLCGGLYAAYNFYQAFRCHQYDPLQLKDIFKPVKCHMLLQQADLPNKTDVQKLELLTECETILRSIHINVANKPFIKTRDLVFELAISFAKCKNPEKSYLFSMEIIEDWQQLEAATILHKYNPEYDPTKLQSILQNVLKKHEQDPKNITSTDFYLEIAKVADKCNLHDVSSTALSKASGLENTTQSPTRKFASFCKLAESYQQIGETSINESIKTMSRNFALQALKSAEAMMNNFNNQEALIAYLKLANIHSGFAKFDVSESDSDDNSFSQQSAKWLGILSEKLSSLESITPSLQFIKYFSQNQTEHLGIKSQTKEIFIKKLDEFLVALKNSGSAEAETKDHKWRAITDLFDIVEAYSTFEETDNVKKTFLLILEILEPLSEKASQSEISQNHTLLNRLVVLFDTLPKDESEQPTFKKIQSIINQLYSKLYFTSEDMMAEYLAEFLIKALKDTPAADELLEKFLKDYINYYQTQNFVKMRKSTVAITILVMFTADEGYTDNQVKKAITEAEKLLPRNEHHLLDPHSKTLIANAYLKIDPTHSQALIDNTLDVEKMFYLITGSITAVGLGILSAYPASVPFIALGLLGFNIKHL